MIYLIIRESPNAETGLYSRDQKVLVREFPFGYLNPRVLCTVARRGVPDGLVEQLPTPGGFVLHSCATQFGCVLSSATLTLKHRSPRTQPSRIASDTVTTYKLYRPAEPLGSLANPLLRDATNVVVLCAMGGRPFAVDVNGAHHAIGRILDQDQKVAVLRDEDE